MAIGMTSGIEKTLKCAAAIATQFLIVKFGADDDTVAQATASTEDLIGVAQHTTANSGDDLRVMFTGITKVKAGGTITRGAWVTSDANGRAVAAAPGAGVNANIIGKAMASAVDGDLFPVLLMPARIQG